MLLHIVQIEVMLTFHGYKPPTQLHLLVKRLNVNYYFCYIVYVHIH